jgi:hypothetical protein
MSFVVPLGQAFEGLYLDSWMAGRMPARVKHGKEETRAKRSLAIDV